jgi:hypothetical protein
MLKLGISYYFLFVFSFFRGYSQEKNVERKLLVENLISASINSKEFDSIFKYDSLKICFNEIITRNDYNINIPFGKSINFDFCNDSILSKPLLYISSLTLNWSATEAASLQIAILPQNITMNFRLIRKNQNWFVDKFSYFLDD